MEQITFESNVKKVNDVFETKNYSMFKMMKGNRVLNQANLRKLRTSLSTKIIPEPIIVNENYEIVDGQHRFAILRELGRGVTFIIIEGVTREDTILLNTASANWGLEDYLKAYCDAEIEEYLKLKEFMETNNLSFSIARLFANFKMLHSEDLDNFKSGNFKFSNMENTEKYLKYYEDFKEIRIGNKVLLTRALIMLFENGNYDHENMKQKLIYKAYELTPRVTIKEYVILLASIYNYKTPQGKQIYFYKV